MSPHANILVMEGKEISGSYIQEYTIHALVLGPRHIYERMMLKLLRFKSIIRVPELGCHETT